VENGFSTNNNLNAEKIYQQFVTPKRVFKNKIETFMDRK
jgi:hypothetical protein